MLNTIRELYRYCRRYPRQFGIGFAFLLISSAMATLPPLFIGEMVDTLSKGTMTFGRGASLVAGLLGVVLLGAVSLVIVRRTILYASWEIQFDIRHNLFQHFTRLSQNYYDTHRVGDMIARLTADLNAVRMMVGVGSFMGVSTVLVVLFTLVRMFSISVPLSLLTLLIVPAMALSFFLLLRRVHTRYERVQEQFSNLSAMAQENFSGVRVVKGFGIEDRELHNFKVLNDEFIRRNLALTRIEGQLWPLIELLFGATIGLLLLVGGREVLGVGSTLTIGQFIDFLFLFEGIQWPMIGMGWIASLFQRGHTSWGRLREILDSEVDIKDNEQTDYSLTEVKGDIEFKEVSLAFDDTVALDNVSFHVREGETFGITGHTGSGKTMIVNLLARLLDPTSGQILIDGRDIREFPVEVLRRHFGIVPQEPFLFSDTIAENIVFGIPQEASDAMLERVRGVARLVQLASDVEDFPQQYQTSLGERGVTLSGGQRQRTAMARAIVRDPNVLVLDDALSAVDTQTEANILQGLKEVAENRTTLIIAHRVSAFQNCKQILVLEHGQLIEQGTHDELIAHGGYYAEIDRKQQLESELAAS